MGVAIRQEISTKTTKSLDKDCQSLATDAPNTLRMPISLVRCSAMNDARPNKPKHEIKMARMETIKESLPMKAVYLNFLAYSASAKA